MVSCFDGKCNFMVFDPKKHDFAILAEDAILRFGRKTILRFDGKTRFAIFGARNCSFVRNHRFDDQKKKTLCNFWQENEGF